MLTFLVALALGGAPRQPAISFWSDFPSGHAQVWVMNADGSGRQRLTDLYSAKRGDWSPDGRRILYTHGPEGAHQVYVMNADGSGKTNLSRSRTDDWATDWR